MDNIGDWLYIVFIAVAIIGSITNGKGKKKAQAKPAEVLPPLLETLPEADEWWSASAEKVSAQPKKKTEIPKPSFMKPTPKDEIKPILEEEKKEMDIRLSSPDDVRRAFVYSEIFNRKYF